MNILSGNYAFYILTIFSIISFYIGNQLGFKNRPEIPCIPVISSNFQPVSIIPKIESIPPPKCPPKPRKTCEPDIVENSNFVFKNDGENSVLKKVFGYLHHPATPAIGELIFSGESVWEKDFSTCKNVFHVRQGTRSDQPCKCNAIVRVSEEKYEEFHNGYYSPTSIKHRIGHIDWPQVLTDQYQDDYMKDYCFPDENRLTDKILIHREELIQHFLDKMGSPFNEDGSRRTVIILVANEGVMDLVNNLLCSARTAEPQIDFTRLVVFLGQPELIPVIESMGAKAIFDPSLGDIPRQSSKSYADRTFARVMWLKVTSVYIALNAGFHVIFQDADLIWLKDPTEYLIGMEKYDMIFMDDGARTPRFAPFFTNTGFYFIRHNAKTIYLQEKLIRSVGEIAYTASHQATFIRHLTEAHYQFGLQILILDDNEFPSGQMYHHQQWYVDLVKSYQKIPYVWHMCWTATREQKLNYFKDMGFWYIPMENTTYNGLCESGSMMLNYQSMFDRGEQQQQQQLINLGDTPDNHRSNEKQQMLLPIHEMCCRKGEYWIRKHTHDQQQQQGQGQQGQDQSSSSSSSSTEIELKFPLHLNQQLLNRYQNP